VVARDVGGRGGGRRRHGRSCHAPAPPRSTRDHLADDAPEVNVDGAVQDKVAREVQRLQRVGDGDRDIVRVTV